MEAELIALASASEEMGWLLDLLSEIPMWEKPMPPVLIHCVSLKVLIPINWLINSRIFM